MAKQRFGIPASGILRHLVWLVTAPFVVLVMGIPLWLMVRLYNWRHGFRVIRLPSERLGHLLGETDVAISSRRLRTQSPHNVRGIFYFSSSRTANDTFTRAARRQLSAWWTYPGWLLDAADRLLRLRRSTREPASIHQQADLSCLTDETEWFPRSAEFNQLALTVRAKLGLTPNMRTVAIFARDSHYERSIGLGPRICEHAHRNSPLEAYFMAADDLCLAGFTPVIMGRNAQDVECSDPLGCGVDYSSSPLAEPAADLALVSSVEFAIGCDSGSQFLPYLFRRPTALVNMAGPFGLSRGGPVVMVCLKHFIDAKSDRELSFSQILQRGAADFSLTSHFTSAGIRVVDCSPGEIAAVARDMSIFIEHLDSAPIGSDRWLQAQELVTVAIPGDATLPRVSRSWADLRPGFLA